MSTGILARRPWLLVWLAFTLLIAGWVATYMISRKAPSQRLTPAEESVILQRRPSQ